MEADLIDGHVNNEARQEPEGGESEQRLSDSVQSDENVTKGITNMAYVASEVAEVASITSENNQRDWSNIDKQYSSVMIDKYQMP